ncbi:MAG: CsgG/HfaB family protein [Thermodesulfobacteriota bacterium]
MEKYGRCTRRAGLGRTAALAAAALFSLAVMGGCAPSMKTRMLVPAKAYEASRLKRVAVMPFTGPDGARVAAEMEAMLAGITIDGKPYFTVIERNALEKVVAEQKLSLSGMVDEQTAGSVGKLAGAEGIFMGNVGGIRADDAHSQATRTRCGAKNQEGKCIRWDEYKVDCTKRTVTFTLTPKVVSTETGQIVSSETLSASASDDQCADSGQALASVNALSANAEKAVMDQFREMIAPYYVDMEIKLITSDDSKMSPEANQCIKDGLAWFKEQRMDRACELWSKAASLHPEGYAIPYLQGVCAEVHGSLDEALEYYRAADARTKKPNKDIALAISRVETKMENRKKLEKCL